ncbi:hypothetical protein ACRALDRAFT_211768 [Sodiomyces alcalophilus JCM 7366]|uniref:uncharacterized protein n=1 Tax=Sodiomyces alcalophilus JCM 7366 TaxID=591952 RepID=UPI0039B622E7
MAQYLIRDEQRSRWLSGTETMRSRNTYRNGCGVLAQLNPAFLVDLSLVAAYDQATHSTAHCPKSGQTWSNPNTCQASVLYHRTERRSRMTIFVRYLLGIPIWDESSNERFSFAMGGGKDRWAPDGPGRCRVRHPGGTIRFIPLISVFAPVETSSVRSTYRTSYVVLRNIVSPPPSFGTVPRLTDWRCLYFYTSVLAHSSLSLYAIVFDPFDSLMAQLLLRIDTDRSGEHSAVSFFCFDFVSIAPWLGVEGVCMNASLFDCTPRRRLEMPLVLQWGAAKCLPMRGFTYAGMECYSHRQDHANLPIIQRIHYCRLTTSHYIPHVNYLCNPLQTSIRIQACNVSPHSGRERERDKRLTPAIHMAVLLSTHCGYLRDMYVPAKSLGLHSLGPRGPGGALRLRLRRATYIHTTYIAERLRIPPSVRRSNRELSPSWWTIAMHSLSFPERQYRARNHANSLGNCWDGWTLELRTWYLSLGLTQKGDSHVAGVERRAFPISQRGQLHSEDTLTLPVGPHRPIHSAKPCDMNGRNETGKTKET